MRALRLDRSLLYRLQGATRCFLPELLITEWMFRNEGTFVCDQGHIMLLTVRNIIKPMGLCVLSLMTLTCYCVLTN